LASLARIPFSPSDEQQINTLTGWMLFMAILHFLGGAFFLTCGCFGAMGGGGMMAVSPAGGILTIIQMLLMLVLGVVLIIEGVMLVQGRSALSSVVTSDTGDQQYLSDAFKRLKFFFMLELVWFAINILVAIIGLLIAIIAPELAGGGFGDFQNLGGGGGGFGGGPGYDPGGNW
jgi:hypothetical protein